MKLIVCTLLVLCLGASTLWAASRSQSFTIRVFLPPTVESPDADRITSSPDHRPFLNDNALTTQLEEIRGHYGLALRKTTVVR